MEFNQQETDYNSIVSIEEYHVKLTHIQLKIPCFISCSYYCEININHLNDINKISLFPLSNQDNINLLIIGSGSTHKFLHPKQQIAIRQMGISTEIMNNKSACRSFNLLLSDARSVGLLLL
ncbi:Mth938-like domain-containing protein [Candidatus Vesicomyidisocius sp. SY067_SCS001]|uniref:Mth938-like domain-containing protein n=1 Tax=Candidatus Vesicomyidisocius sp. SY067_SCS001 TaxID=2732590 RepID=UPI001689E083|nr:Mth938-like domain-containing protein [Candidatus Vesicomyosocius sp. SY067_SCS001]